MNIGEVVASLKLNAAEFVSGVKSAASAWDDMAGNLMKGGAALSVGITAPLVGVGSAAMSMATQLQSAEIGFATMLGSAEKAGEFLEELKDFAAKTPFEFKDLTEAAKRMMALGFAAKDVVPTMTAIGNASAGLGGGAALIDRITLALGQMGAKGKVSAEEMRQLAEAGIPAWDMLAKAIGVSIPEAMKMAEKGAIQAAQAIPAIVEGMNDKFGGLMENFSTTVMGRWSNIQDSLGYVLADIGKSLMPLANQILEQVVIPITEFIKTLAEGFASLPDPIKFVIVALAALAAAVGPLLVAMGGLMSTVGPLFAEGALLGVGGLAAQGLAILSPMLGPLALAIAAVAAAWGLWQLEPVQNAVKQLWDVVTGFWESTLKPFLETVYNLGAAFVSAATSIIGSGLIAYWETLKAGMTALVEAGGWLYDQLKDLWEWIASAASVFQPFWDFIVGITEAVALLAAGLTVGAFSLAYEMFSMLTDAFKLQWEAAKVLGSILWDVLIAAFKASIEPIKALWNILGPMLGAALDAVATQFRTVSSILSTILNPVINVVKKALEELLGALMKLPGVKQVVEGVSGAFNSFKETVSNAMKGAASDTEKLNPTLATLKGNVDAAKKTYDELFARFEKGEDVTKQLSVAQTNLTKATGEFDKALKASGLSIESAQKKVSTAADAYAAAKKVYEQLKASYDGSAKSTEALKTAQDNMARSASALKQAQSDLRATTSLLGKETENTANKGQIAIKAAGGLKEEQKLLKAEVEKLTLAYKEAIRTNDGTEASLARITAAQVKLQEASDKLDPTKPAERAAKGWEEAEKRYADQQKEFEKLIADVIKLNEALAKADADLAKQAFDTATDFAKAHEVMRKAAEKPIAITVQLDKQITPEMAALLKETQDFEKAVKQLGITTSSELNKSVVDAEKAYEIVLEQYNKGRTGAYELLQAEQAVLEARVRAAKAAGEEISEAEQDRLEEVNKSLEKYGEKQVGFWQKMGQQISTIINDFAKDISEGLLDLITGGSRNEHNKKLEEQQADLQKSLDERTQEWEDYQQEVQATWEATQDEYAKKLEEDLAELRESLDERVQEYADAERETQDKLDSLRVDNASRLEEELRDLQDTLDDKRSEYDAYVADVNQKFAEIRTEHADKLAEQLRDLQDNLKEKQQAYQEYVREVAKDLNRLYEDYNENIDDETRDTQRGIDDKQKAYDRYAEDVAAKLQKLKDAGESDSEEADKLRLDLNRKREDLQEYIARAQEDLEEYTSDQQRRLQREEADLKESLQKRQDTLNAYLAEQTQKRDQLVADNTASLAKEEQALRDSFAKKTKAWEDYKAATAAKADEIVTQYAEKLAEEEAKLQASLDKKKKALDEYTEENKKKQQKAVDAYVEGLAKEEEKLAASFAKKQAEYEKFVDETNAKLAELSEGFRTVGDDIKTFLTEALESAAMALSRFVTESLVGELIGAIKGPVYDAFKWLGSEVVDIFKGVAGLIGDLFGAGSSVVSSIPGASSYPTVPGVTPPPYNPSSGTTGAAGQAASSGIQGVVGIVTGAVSAISSVVSNFQQYGMNKSLDLIEHETRYSQIHLGYILEKLNEFLPGIKVLVEDIFYGQLLGATGTYGQMLTQLEDISNKVGPIDLVHAIAVEISSGVDRLQELFGEIARDLGSEGVISQSLEGTNDWLRSQYGKLESIADFTYQTTTKFESIYSRLGDIDKDLYNGPLLKSTDRIGDAIRDLASQNRQPNQITVNVQATTNASPAAIASAVASALRLQGVRA